jgi:two-component system, LytTR family, response regulator
MLNCIIVDDEQNAIDLLKAHVRASGLLHLAHATTSPFEALQIINQQPIHLAFLDIDMPEMTGLELAKAVHGKCRVIFTTAYAEFVSDAYDLDIGVLDYLLKPIPLPRFVRAVQRAINIIAPLAPVQAPRLAISDLESLEHDYIYIKTEQKGALKAIMLTDIDYVEAMQKYVEIHHCGLKTMALLGMKEVADKLPQKFFMRVHKSFIVAMLKIVKVEGNRLQLEDIPNPIPIGEVYRATFIEAMKGKLIR